jgi:acyl carrier protein
MNEQEIRDAVFQALKKIAPEADLESFDASVRFRDQMEFDSVDCLNLINRLEKATGTKVPESEYPGLSSLNGIVAYFSVKNT